MKKYPAVVMAIIACAGGLAPGPLAHAQVTSSSSVCVQFVCAGDNSTTSLTTSASQTTDAANFASAHTGLVVTRPLRTFPNFAVQSGSSGVAASVSPGNISTASARWSDTWRCIPAGSCLVGPGFGMFQWVLHLQGVIDPLLLAPPSSAQTVFLSLLLTYRIPSTGHTLIFAICYDSGPCGNGGAINAVLDTPSGEQDLTSSIVLGTNAAGQPTVSLDVSLGTQFCLLSPDCTWNDVFKADVDLENNGSGTHFIDFSGTFIGSAVSLDPNNAWASDGGQSAPISPALVTSYSGQYLAPLTQSTNASNPAINNVKNGRVVPVKVQLSQGSTAITDQNAPGPITIRVTGPLACGAAPPGDIGVYADAGSSSGGTNQFRYDATMPGWIYNLDTRALHLTVGSCYRIDAAVNGTVIPNAFVIIRPTM
jgi:hypothetical protein